jgi:hypothetical protein
MITAREREMGTSSEKSEKRFDFCHVEMYESPTGPSLAKPTMGGWRQMMAMNRQKGHSQKGILILPTSC